MKNIQNSKFLRATFLLKMLFKGCIVLALFGMYSCTKFVQVNPPVTSITGVTAFANNTSASAAMTSIYDNMITSTRLSSGSPSIGYLEGLAADELQNYKPTNKRNSQFYENTLNSNNSDPGWWVQLYQEIYAANAVIAGLSSATGVSLSIKNQLIGEAKFMRAFLHFYATNLYGDVPLVTTTNYLVNNVISRTPQAAVYMQIIQDLKDAQTDLTDNFLDPYGNTTTERVRPNKGAASALLARVYLFTKQWDSAEAQATAVINNSGNYGLDSNLDDVFLANSSEAIWQFQSIVPGINTWDAQYYVLTSPPGSYFLTSVALSSYLLNAFEPGDMRALHWVGAYTADSITYYYYPYKYKLWIDDPSQPATEYTMVLRLAEQYLIRAEARAQQNNVLGAQADLNVIRTRSGLPNTLASDQPSLLTAILHERQVEFFTEWGHRWFDLIRTGAVNFVMGSPGNECLAKGGTWSPNWELMPIPESEIKVNSNLKQNPGYN